MQPTQKNEVALEFHQDVGLEDEVFGLFCLLIVYFIWLFYLVILFIILFVLLFLYFFF